MAILFWGLGWKQIRGESSNGNWDTGKHPGQANILGIPKSEPFVPTDAR